MQERSLWGLKWWVTSFEEIAPDSLIVPMQRLAVGHRAFYVAAARTWNSLPFGLTSTSSLSTFRRQLKTLLCTRSYPDSFQHTCQTVFVLCHEFSFFVTFIGVFTVVLTLRHLNQFFHEWVNKWMNLIAQKSGRGEEILSQNTEI